MYGLMEFFYTVKKSGICIGNERVECSEEDHKSKIVFETDLVGYKAFVQIETSKLDSKILNYNKVVSGNLFQSHFSLSWLEEKDAYLSNKGKYLITKDVLYCAEQIKFFLLDIMKTNPILKYCVYDYENDRFWYYKLHSFNEHRYQMIYPESAVCLYNQRALEEYYINHSSISEYLNHSKV